MMPLHQRVAVQKELHNCHLEVCGLLFWEEAEARILFLWLIDLTLGLLSRICHARSDLLSALFRILFWQHLSKLDFLHLLRVYSGNFIRTTQPHSLKRPSIAIGGAVCFKKFPLQCWSPPLYYLLLKSVESEKRNPITCEYIACGYGMDSAPTIFGKEAPRGSL